MASLQNNWITHTSLWLLCVMVACQSPQHTGNPKTEIQDFDFVRVELLSAPPLPERPRKAVDMGTFGTVGMKMTVDPTGLPSEVVALSGPIELQSTALGWSRSMKFRPALLKNKKAPEGVPQFASVRVSITWTQQGASFELTR